MEQEIYLKYQKFRKECDIFFQKFILCQKIVTKLTDAIIKNDVRTESKMQSTEEMKEFFEAVKSNLDIFTELIERHNKNTDHSFDQLVTIENDLTLFTYKQCDFSRYNENTVGECVISKVEDFQNGLCYINDLNRPKPMISNVCGHNLTKYPDSGELFAINWKDLGLVRAVRSDLIFREREKLIVYLVDIGKRVEIPYNLKRLYSLPREFGEMESCAIPCKVSELIDENGSQLDVPANLRGICKQTAHFEVQKVKNNILWVKLRLKPNDEIIIADADYQDDKNNYDVQDDKNTNDTETIQEYFFGTDAHSMEDTIAHSIPMGSTIAESEFTCDICDCRFKTKKQMKTHMNSHISTGSQLERNAIQMNACKFCKKTFRLKFELKIHLKSHVNENDIDNSCEFCQKSFSSKGNLNTHRRMHMGDKPFKCTVCDADFVLRLQLNRHIEGHKIFCKFCDKTFSVVMELKQHLKSHGSINEYICDTCGKIYANRQSLKTHLNLHTKDKSYPCEICGRVFFAYDSLCKHLKTHSGGKSQCRICGKEFSSNSNLNRHLRIHLGQKSFVCKICTKGFTQSGTLKEHLRIHRDEN